MKRNIYLILILIVLVITGFFAFNKFIYQQKQHSENKTIESYRGTLTGIYVCLPHKNTSGPQTLECAFGIKTDVDEYYALDLNLMSQEAQTLNIGDKITATGVITPIEMLSTNHWKTYNVSGIFSVTDSLKIEKADIKQ